MQGSVVKIERKRKAQQKDHLGIAKPLKPLNEAQRQCIHAFKEGLNVFAYGSAGTGKSYLACSLGLEKLFLGDVEKIIIVRSATQTREIGFTPGTETEKALVYAMPYKCIINDICGNGTAWDILHKKGMVEFITTSFIRGITLDNCIVIFDECQNTTFSEFSSVITRAGKNCQMFICGDGKQNDLTKKKNDSSGFDDVIKVIRNMPNYFDLVGFTPADIVRSGMVKQWVIECEELGL